MQAFAEAFAPLGVTEFDNTTVQADTETDPTRPRLTLIALPRYERTPLYTL